MEPSQYIALWLLTQGNTTHAPSAPPPKWLIVVGIILFILFIWFSFSLSKHEQEMEEREYQEFERQMEELDKE